MPFAFQTDVRDVYNQAGYAKAVRTVGNNASYAEADGRKHLEDQSASASYAEAVRYRQRVIHKGCE